MFKLILVMLTLTFSQQAYSDQNEVECLAKNIYFEARGESLSGMVAVANVTMNRVRHARFPDTVCGVVQQAKHSKWWADRGRIVPVRNKCQFSWYCDGKSDTITDYDAYREAIRVASVVYNGYIDITGGSLYYHNHTVRPYWAKSMLFVKVIGAHNFYRESG